MKKGSGLGGRIAVVGLLLLTSGVFARYEETTVSNGGTLRGRVTFEGEAPTQTLMVNSDQKVCDHTKGKIPSPRLQVSPEGGVANAVVYLKAINAGKPMESLQTSMQLDQEGCLYDPFVQLIPRAGVLTLINSDPLNHNVHAKQEGARDPFNYAMPNSAWPEKQTIQKLMLPPGIVTVSCDVHMWMNAYLFVVEHPYYAVTDADGNFTLEGVPAGEYELTLWHAGWQADLKRDSSGQIAGYDYGDPIELNQTVKVGEAETVSAEFLICRDGQ